MYVGHLGIFLVKKLPPTYSQNIPRYIAQKKPRKQSLNCTQVLFFWQDLKIFSAPQRFLAVLILPHKIPLKTFLGEQNQNLYSSTAICDTETVSVPLFVVFCVQNQCLLLVLVHRLNTVLKLHLIYIYSYQAGVIFRAQQREG